MILTKELVNKLYIDGVLVGTGIKSLDNWASYNGHIYIGQRGTSDWNWYYSGKIDDIRIYDRELSALEILNLYNTNCSISEIYGDREVCQGKQNVNYYIQPLDNATYLWDYTGIGAIINGNTNSIMVDFSSNATAGNLSVTILHDTLPSQKSEVPITIINLPENAGMINGPTEVCINQDIVNYSIPAIPNAIGYEWSYSGTGAIITRSSNSVQIEFTENATNGSLSVFGYNDCGAGSSSPEYPILVKSCNDVHSLLNIPNAFSPNGDGINDLFIIRGLSENSELMIFDRSGKMVYHAEKYQNNWDGKDSEGNVLKIGTYWYVLVLSGIQTSFKGFVYIKK
jgi:gliding motility-associated-like protein